MRLLQLWRKFWAEQRRKSNEKFKQEVQAEVRRLRKEWGHSG